MTWFFHILQQMNKAYLNRKISNRVVNGHPDLDEYVTLRALDGLYFMLGEEEKKIRKDPAAAAKSIIRKVFGAVR